MTPPRLLAVGELESHRAGVAWLAAEGIITAGQAGVMIGRAEARRLREAAGGAGGLREMAQARPRLRGVPAGGLDSMMHTVEPPAGTRLVLPPVPLARLRRLSREERWQALLFLSGLCPREVEVALAAVLTPLSTAGTAR